MRAAGFRATDQQLAGSAHQPQISRLQTQTEIAIDFQLSGAENSVESIEQLGRSPIRTSKSFGFLNPRRNWCCSERMPSAEAICNRNVPSALKTRRIFLRAVRASDFEKCCSTL